MSTIEHPARVHVSAEDRAQGQHPRVLAVLDRPQDHRAPVPDHLVLLLPVRRDHGDADADPAARPGPARGVRPAVQRAVHHARRDHAAAVRHPAVHRVRQRAAAAADRRARRGVPAAQPAQLLPVHLRRADPAGQLPHPGRRGVVRLVRVLPADQRDLLARRRRRHVDHGPGAVRARHHPGRGQLHHHDLLHARARHDDVPDADLHLERAAHLDDGADSVPGAGRRAAGARDRPAAGRARLRRLQRRRDLVAAPVLVLRPPRGLHPGDPVLRHRDRDHPGVQPQAAVRLQDA